MLRHELAHHVFNGWSCVQYIAFVVGLVVVTWFINRFLNSRKGSNGTLQGSVGECSRPDVRGSDSRRQVPTNEGPQCRTERSDGRWRQSA